MNKEKFFENMRKTGKFTEEEIEFCFECTQEIESKGENMLEWTFHNFERAKRYRELGKRLNT